MSHAVRAHEVGDGAGCAISQIRDQGAASLSERLEDKAERHCSFWRGAKPPICGRQTPKP